jgi:GntR family transcriptional regulator
MRTSRMPQPRYAGVEAALRRRIMRGVYKRGDCLPSEKRLAEEFTVSRFTVREALRRLNDSGLISRQQGARSSVTGTMAESIYSLSVGAAEDLQEYAYETYLEISDITKFQARAPMARFLRCREKKEWLLVSGARRNASNGRMVGFTEVYLWAEFEPHIPEITARGLPIHRQIEDKLHLNASIIRQEISAIAIPENAASVLGCEAGSAGLEIVRRYFGTRGRAFEVARNVHPAGSFTYAQDFQRREVAAE